MNCVVFTEKMVGMIGLWKFYVIKTSVLNEKCGGMEKK